jgi:beta-glucanase (GH16 family)
MRADTSLLLPLAILAAACGASGPAATQTPATPVTPPGPWVLSWSDEFDGPAGALVDGTRWLAETGGHGWGNQERQFYTARAENASLDGNGHLVITARAESPSAGYSCWYGPCGYTSARLITKGRFEQTYGRFEARIKIPRGQGIWPAFWLLGANIDGVGWPRCGEIDVMENIGREPSVVHGTVHGPGYSGAAGISRSYALSSGALADDYHLYAIEWERGDIRWYLDGQEFHRVTTNNLPSGTAWAFDHAFFVLLNVAVGGSWPGDPDASTSFPQQMLVDYVRVYRR